MKDTEPKGYIVNQAGLPSGYPTHAQTSNFWEALGRAVASFGFLEEILLKAIFALTVTTPYEESELDAAYAAWLPKITRSLSDSLGSLIDTYGKAVREHPNARVESLDDLLADLRAACKLRNVICHGSWRPPDRSGGSVPFYVNKQGEEFETVVDCTFLYQLHEAVANLTCEVINTVTHMGWQFPASNGPGSVIWQQGIGASESNT